MAPVAVNAACGSRLQPKTAANRPIIPWDPGPAMATSKVGIPGC